MENHPGVIPACSQVRPEAPGTLQKFGYSKGVSKSNPLELDLVTF